jgi:hypothetical protein
VSPTDFRLYLAVSGHAQTLCMQVQHRSLQTVTPARYELADLLEKPCMRCRFIWWSPDFAGCTWLCPGHAQTLFAGSAQKSADSRTCTLRARRLVRGLACDVSSFGWVLQTLQAVPAVSRSCTNPVHAGTT